MKGQNGMPGNDYADGMVEHDGDVGKLLKTLDDLDIANNTTQFERWFIAGLAHFYTNNIAS